MANDDSASARLRRRSLFLSELDRMRLLRSRTGTARRREAQRRAITRRTMLNAY